MKTNHAAAIIRWRDQLDDLGIELTSQKSATVSTMLFGCIRWLEANPADQSALATRISGIKAELEQLLADQGVPFVG